MGSRGGATGGADESEGVGVVKAEPVGGSVGSVGIISIAAVPSVEDESESDEEVGLCKGRKRLVELEELIQSLEVD
jgi:hypothetical protein